MNSLTVSAHLGSHSLLTAVNRAKSLYFATYGSKNTINKNKLTDMWIKYTKYTVQPACVNFLNTCLTSKVLFVCVSLLVLYCLLLFTLP